MLLAAEFDFFKKCSSVVHCQRVAIFSEIEFKCEKDSREDDDDMQDFSSAECRIHRRNSDDKRRRKREKIVGRRENAQLEQKEANATVKWARKK